MFKHVKKSPWDSYVENFRNALWGGHYTKACNTASLLVNMLQDMIASGNLDSQLIDTLYRLADMYCFELCYSDAEALYQAVLAAQTNVLGQNDPHIVDTLNKLTKLKQLQDYDTRISKETIAVSGEFDRLVFVVS